MNTKNTKKNTNMNKSTPEVAVKATEKKETAKPKLTAAYIKEMVAKGLSPLTGKPIRHYSHAGKRYAGKATAVAATAVTEKVEAKTAETPVTKTDAVKPVIPVLKAKKGVKKAKKA